ncbi:MAG: TIGR00730 family Rossman fold protein [Saprospiraceae bacterium]|nr:TIGR00730 family Rossman fold protein [Saprospiraceae bacterium]
MLNSNTQFLDGPNARGAEFRFAFKVFRQFINGFRKLHFIGPCITVFGSARFDENHPDYILAREIGREIAEMGFTTMTGGGPGIMEAANRGAFENDGYSVGCSIHLPNEQVVNPFMHRYVHFEHFFVRKTLLLKYSYAFVVMPGGFGTLDELFETLTLIQTGIINNFPVVIMGKDFYREIRHHIQNMIDRGTISKKDENLVLFTDEVPEAIEHIRKYVLENYKVKNKRIRPRWWLFEKE